MLGALRTHLSAKHGEADVWRQSIQTSAQITQSSRISTWRRDCWCCIRPWSPVQWPVVSNLWPLLLGQQQWCCHCMRDTWVLWRHTTKNTFSIQYKCNACRFMQCWTSTHSLHSWWQCLRKIRIPRWMVQGWGNSWCHCDLWCKDCRTN